MLCYHAFLSNQKIFIVIYQWIKSFKSLDAVSNVQSNLETFKDIGKVCWKVVLLFIISSSDSVRLGKLT